MRIGVPAEVKSDEYRVALTPAGAYELVRHGHDVWVEHGAGEGSGFPDDAYERVGARDRRRGGGLGLRPGVKVKEPQPSEFGFLHDDQVLFTYLHLAAEPGRGRRAAPRRDHRRSPTRPWRTARAACRCWPR